MKERRKTIARTMWFEKKSTVQRRLANEGFEMGTSEEKIEEEKEEMKMKMADSNRKERLP